MPNTKLVVGISKKKFTRNTDIHINMYMAAMVINELNFWFVLFFFYQLNGFYVCLSRFFFLFLLDKSDTIYIQKQTIDHTNKKKKRRKENSRTRVMICLMNL